MADVKTDEPRFAPLCIWCGAPWSEENVKLEVEASMEGYESTGYTCEGSATLTIACHSCKREMYRKEGVSSW